MRVLYILALLGLMTMTELPIVSALEQKSDAAAQSKSAEKPVVTYKPHQTTAFHTSDRCVACHNGMKTNTGEDFSIGSDWESSAMANSSRDPYWQGSIRRESMEHPESSTFIQNDCSNCHMPAVRLADRDANRNT